MLHQTKAISAKTLSADISSLSYIELAVALHASGASPRDLRSATPSQAAEWAARGVALAGVETIRSKARRTANINLAGAWHTPEYSKLWPSFAAEQRCCDAADRIIRNYS